MNIFANMSIKYKLALLALLPLLGLIYFSASNIQEKYHIEQQMTAIQDLSLYAVKASALVHETQKERGATAGYLGSKGMKFKTELPSQRNETDRKISELKEFLTGFDANQYGRGLVSALNNSMNRLDNISNIRSNVTGLTISAKDAIGYYTKMNTAFLNSIALIAKVAENGKIVREATAYINYLMAKERAGIERAVMANTFARDNFAEGAYQKFGNLVSEQATYAAVFQSLASEEQKNFYNNKMTGDAVQQVKQMRAAAYKNAAEGNFGINATAWFRAATARINLYKGGRK